MLSHLFDGQLLMIIGRLCSNTQSDSHHNLFQLSRQRPIPILKEFASIPLHDANLLLSSKTTWPLSSTTNYSTISTTYAWFLCQPAVSVRGRVYEAALDEVNTNFVKH